MQPTFTEIKKAGLKALKNRWPQAIMVSLVLLTVIVLDLAMQYVLMTILRVDSVWTPVVTETITLVEVLIGCVITGFSSVFYLLVVFPLAFGVLRWFWLVTGGSDPDVNDIFYYFSSSKLYFKTVGISFGVIWRIIVAAVLCFLPSIVCNQLLRPEIYNYFGYAMPIWLSGLFPLVSLLIIWGFASFALWVARYALTYVVIFKRLELSVNKTIKESVRVAHGQRLRYIGFLLSFFGWIALCLLVLPIIFVLPFMLAAFCIYGREEYRFFEAVSTVNG